MAKKSAPVKYLTASKKPPSLARFGRKVSRMGVASRIETVKSEKNGNSRRIAQIKFPDGSETTAYIPMGVLGITEGSPVLLRASRSPKVPEIHLRVKPLSRTQTAFNGKPSDSGMIVRGSLRHLKQRDKKRSSKP
ncbi:hypothetical protein [Streptomyces sp. G1]|uniref:hypothetical protein n=1 Tax=Streptomyces sp. G1 TaxID=361572 RepID=UPI00202FB96E|nr:hypothetical protein [Streptomyces sp. G1]